MVCMVRDELNRRTLRFPGAADTQDPARFHSWTVTAGCWRKASDAVVIVTVVQPISTVYVVDALLPVESVVPAFPEGGSGKEDREGEENVPRYDVD
jgi:hypothetical protein